MRGEGRSLKILLQMTQRLHPSYTPECAGGCDSHFAVGIIKHRNQSCYDFVSRTDTGAGSRANQRVWMSQKSQSNVTCKDDAELRRDRSRCDQRRPLNDLLDDQSGDGSRRLRNADGAKRVERRNLLWHNDVGAPTYEAIAQRRSAGTAALSLRTPASIANARASASVASGMAEISSSSVSLSGTTGSADRAFEGRSKSGRSLNRSSCEKPDMSPELQWVREQDIVHLRRRQ